MPNIITRHTTLRAIVSQESRRETQLNSQRQTQATDVIISLNAESRKLDALHPTSWLVVAHTNRTLEVSGSTLDLQESCGDGSLP
jgi:hypothetical protein